MDLSVITVTWNSKDIIGRQIKSVFSGFKRISAEEIVVDNASADGTVDFIKQEFSNLKLIANEDNLGFATANNLGTAVASGDYLLFLNPDMKVTVGSLDVMVEWMKKKPEVGIVSCKLVDEQGKFNFNAGPRRFPGLFDQLMILLKIPHIFPFVLNKYLMKNFDPDIEQEVNSVRGAFLLMRRELYEKMGFAFDPRYFFWFEDVDTCREAKRLGYKVVYNPIVSCVDYVGQSFKKRDSLWKQKNFTASMIKYFQKWEPWYCWITLFLLRPFIIVFAWLNEKIKINRTRI